MTIRNSLVLDHLDDEISKDQYMTRNHSGGNPHAQGEKSGRLLHERSIQVELY
jgi:hypothetical protein